MPAVAAWSTSALPVVVATADGAVARYVEGVLGWQVVAADDLLVRPRVAIVDAASAVDPLPGTLVGLPIVLLVGADDDPVTVGRAARGADAVIAWPAESANLAEAVVGLIDRPIDRAPAMPTLAVGAAAGGVGATTVALGVAALAAWDLRLPTLALVTGWSPVPALPTVTGDDLEAPSLWETARPAPGVSGLRVARLAAPLPDHGGSAAIAGPSRVVVEVRAGVADLLVARPDGAGRDAIAASSAGTIVVVGDGPVPPRDLVRGAAGRRLVRVDDDPRIARASLVGRVPADLPGRWLDRLRDALG